MTTGRISPGGKDTWWWNDEVKDAKIAIQKKRQRRSGAHQERRKRETSIGKQPRRQRKK